jgi:hypothetical protein
VPCTLLHCPQELKVAKKQLLRNLREAEDLLMANERERRGLKQQAAESAEQLDALSSEVAALRAALEGAQVEADEMCKALQVRTCCITACQEALAGL